MPEHDIAVTEAEPHEKAVLGNLLQFYMYDFTEFVDLVLDDSGCFRVSAHFDRYWSEPDRHPFLIRARGRLAGFALVHQLEPGVHSIAEFFVLRTFRRRAVGKTAAFVLFDRFPGEWHVAQEETNIPAQRFWTTIIAEYTGGDFQRAVSLRDPSGPKQIFRSRIR
jgi:predicted acetyltransferase